jgi:hypothetical protein
MFKKMFLMSMVSAALATSGVGLVAAPQEEIKVGQAVDTKVDRCWRANIQDAVEIGLPQEICFSELAVILHPSDPFSSPKLQIQKGELSGSYSLNLHGWTKKIDTQNPQVEWFRVQTNIYFLQKIVPQPSRSTSPVLKTLSLELQINAVTGKIQTESLVASGVVQKLMDEYHPDGEPFVVGYVLQ